MEPHEQTVGLEKFGIRTHSELKIIITEAAGTRYLIENLIPHPSLTTVIGNSGVGKSPLLYQALLSITAGIPFLGRDVMKGRALYMDCENGLAQVEEIVAQLAKHLNLPEVSEDLLLWNLNYAPENWGGEGCQLEDVIRSVEPDVVVLDPLNAIYKDLERDNTTANAVLQSLRRLMRQYGCSILGVHHPRKADPKHPNNDQSFESGSSRRWFDNARGPGVLINGSDVRLGVEPAKADISGMQLILGGYRRVHGEIPMIRVSRVLDEDGEAVGYNLMRADESLPQELRAVFDRLPEEFQFKDAMAAYGRKNEATSDFLKKFISAGLLKKIRKGWYQKVHPPGNDGTAAMPIQLVPAA